jgi:hypothetical protein
MNIRPGVCWAPQPLDHRGWFPPFSGFGPFYRTCTLAAPPLQDLPAVVSLLTDASRCPPVLFTQGGYATSWGCRSLWFGPAAARCRGPVWVVHDEPPWCMTPGLGPEVCETLEADMVRRWWL